MDSTEKSQLLQTALGIIDGYNKWDIDAIMALRAPECTQHILPYRMNRPPMDNDQFREYLSKLMPFFKSFKVDILDTVEDPRQNKVTFHARSVGETVMGPYANEYMLILEMTTDHLKCLSMKEFVDSGYSDEYFKKLREYISKAGSKS